MGPDEFQPDQQGESRRRYGERRPGEARQRGDEFKEIGEEAVLGDVHPEELGKLVEMMTRPIPVLNPMRTGSEMKLARKPKRRRRATMSASPTRTVRVAVATASRTGSPSGTTIP